MPKIKNFTFNYSLNSFGRDPPRSMYEERIWCVLSGEIPFEMFTLIWYNVNENENNRKKKNQKFKFLKTKKWFGDMLDRYLPLKFGVNPPDGFRENECLWTDGRRTPTS